MGSWEKAAPPERSFGGQNTIGQDREISVLFCHVEEALKKESDIEPCTPWGTPLESLDEETRKVFQDEVRGEEEDKEEPEVKGEAFETQAQAAGTGDQAEAESVGIFDPRSFNDLKHCRAVLVKGALSIDDKTYTLMFDNVDGELDMVILSRNENDAVANIVKMRRMTDELHVCSSPDEWHVFKLKKVLPGWERLLPDGVLLEKSHEAEPER